MIVSGANLSPQTRDVISQWLRGARKGYGVNLVDYADSCEWTDSIKDQVVRELWELSNKDGDLDWTLRWGFGLTVPPLEGP